MRASLSDYFQDEAWQQLAIDINDLVRELGEVGDSHKYFRELRMRLVKVKLGHIKLRLAKLKQNLSHHLEQLEDRLRDGANDEEVRYLVALVTEHLADMWLMESLLERVTKSSDKGAERSSVVPYELPSARSSKSDVAGEAV